MTVLVVGSGGREHAIAWALAKNGKVIVAPGNAGTAGTNISNESVNINNNEDVLQLCKRKKVSLVIVGPEIPLVNGLADHLNANGVPCLGPSAKAAQIEASKAFAKEFMDKHKIPTARWKAFNSAEEAKAHVTSAPYQALVVKASGLAAGKGVIVAKDKQEAVQAIDSLKKDCPGSDILVVEELLTGEEVSVKCFSDGKNISVMPPAQDHKRLLDGDKGPNTGGMGAYCPCPLVSPEELEIIKKTILQRTIDAMRSEGHPFVGVLFAGLMMTKEGPKVLEFNCRFGDPETQSILPLLKTPLQDILLACVKGKLADQPVEWHSDRSAVGVVLVSGGYPNSYPKGKKITGLADTDAIVFHAGTQLNGEHTVTSGGRVLATVGVADTLEAAAKKAYEAAKVIQFEGCFYRKDIGQKALRRMI